MKCSNCGAYVSEGADYCPECGAQFVDESVSGTRGTRSAPSSDAPISKSQIRKGIFGYSVLSAITIPLTVYIWSTKWSYSVGEVFQLPAILGFFIIWTAVAYAVARERPWDTTVAAGAFGIIGLLYLIEISQGRIFDAYYDGATSLIQIASMFEIVNLWNSWDAIQPLLMIAYLGVAALTVYSDDW